MQFDGRWETYDKKGYVLRDAPEVYFLYALFALEREDIAHVKIGISQHVYNRVVDLRTGIPYPIGVVLFTRIGGRKLAYRLERLIHKVLDDRREAGEWFKFDMSKEEDKQVFHGATRLVYERETTVPLEWRKITPAQITAWADMRRYGETLTW